MPGQLILEPWTLQRLPGLLECTLQDFGLIERVSPADALTAAELQLFESLMGEFSKVSATFMKEEIELIDSLADPKNFKVVEGKVQYKKKALDRLHGRASKAFGSKYAKTVEGAIETSIGDYYRTAQKMAAKRLKMPKPSLSLRDKGAIGRLQKNALWFVSTNYDRILQPRINNAFVSAFKEGIDRNQLADRLRTSFGQKLGITENQLQLLSSSTLVRARSISNVYQFDEAGILTYMIIAILDKRTSKICRWLNGRKFSVKEAVKQADRITNLSDPADIKYEHPWVEVDDKAAQDGKNALFIVNRSGNRQYLSHSKFGTNDEPKGRKNTAMTNLQLQKGHNLGFPPYHTHCRTSVIAET